MIYLIDDKKSRQELLGWSQNKINQYSNYLKVVYSYNQIVEENLNNEENIYSSNSIILMHESFFNAVENRQRKDSIEISNELNDFCAKKSIPLVKFSGSSASRSIEQYNIGLPVNVLYQNLEFFLNSMENGESLDTCLKTLMFGKNFNIEEVLQLKKEIWETRFKFSPLLNSKINQFNVLTGKSIDLRSIQDPIILKALINE